MPAFVLAIPCRRDIIQVFGHRQAELPPRRSDRWSLAGHQQDAISLDAAIAQCTIAQRFRDAERAFVLRRDHTDGPPRYDAVKPVMRRRRRIKPETLPLKCWIQHPSCFWIRIKIIPQPTRSKEKSCLSRHSRLSVDLHSPLPKARNLPMPGIAQKRIPAACSRPRLAGDMRHHFRLRPDLCETPKILPTHAPQGQTWGIDCRDGSGHRARRFRLGGRFGSQTWPSTQPRTSDNSLPESKTAPIRRAGRRLSILSPS